MPMLPHNLHARHRQQPHHMFLQYKEDFYSIDLMGAYEELGKIIGEAVEDDQVLPEVTFSASC